MTYAKPAAALLAAAALAACASATLETDSSAETAIQDPVPSKTDSSTETAIQDPVPSKLAPVTSDPQPLHLSIPVGRDVTGMDFSPDGTVLAVLLENGDVVLHDHLTGVRTGQFSAGPADAVAYDPDSAGIAVLRSTGDIALYRTDGTPAGSADIRFRPVGMHHVAWHPSSVFFARKTETGIDIRRIF